MNDVQGVPQDANGETTDQKVDRLTVVVQKGLHELDEKIGAKVDALAVSVKEGFDAVDKRFDSVDKRLGALEEKTTRIEATMVTKSYLDEKLFSLKGDLIAKMRKFEGGLLFLATMLRERRVLSDADVERLRTEYQVFPTIHDR